MPVDETRWPEVPEPKTTHEQMEELSQSFARVGNVIFRLTPPPGYIAYVKFLEDAFEQVKKSPPILISNKTWHSGPYHTRYIPILKEEEPKPELLTPKKHKHEDAPSWKKNCTGPRKGPAYKAGKKRY